MMIHLEIYPNIKSMSNIIRPITPIIEFEDAFEKADLNDSEKKIVEYIRYIGCFTQPSLSKALQLNSKPPALSVLCNICRKIGIYMPEHFASVREWSEKVSENNVRWDGDLICSVVFDIDGNQLTPESGTVLYHTFVVHKELFQGLD